MSREYVQDAFGRSAQTIATLAGADTTIDAVAHAATVIAGAYRRGGCLFVAGNGGSAADAQHIVAEFVSKLDRDRTPLRAFALTVDTSILTAIGNDYGFDELFARQVRAGMRPEDVLLAITTSGNSGNIVAALRACHELGATSILLGGRDGGKAKALATYTILAPGSHTGLIQQGHSVIYHALCGLVEELLVEAGICHYQ